LLIDIKAAERRNLGTMTKARSNVQLIADQGLQEAAAQYVWNKVHGKPMREIARATGVHASTVMRHVRKIENNAEDPNIQALIRAAEAAPMDMGHSVGAEIARAKKSLRVAGSVLVVSKGMKRAVILHPTENGEFEQATVISDAAVHMMVLQSTVRAIAHGRITKYVLSEDADGTLPIEASAPVRLVDSPMENLARRKDNEGRPFLERYLIKAGLRLHEEFRLTGCEAQIETYLNDLLCQRRSYELPQMPAERRALEQFRATVDDLGPGLAEVAVRCCCFEQGLEKTEQIMGWSARSGKIVLRIALQRLKRYYDTIHGAGGGTIG
jgi:DNA-directed RNA polymerase specialized sigma24 family protein